MASNHFCQNSQTNFTHYDKAEVIFEIAASNSNWFEAILFLLTESELIENP